MDIFCIRNNHFAIAFIVLLLLKLLSVIFFLFCSFSLLAVAVVPTGPGIVVVFLCFGFALFRGGVVAAVNGVIWMLAL